MNARDLDAFLLALDARDCLRGFDPGGFEPLFPGDGIAGGIETVFSFGVRGADFGAALDVGFGDDGVLAKGAFAVSTPGGFGAWVKAHERTLLVAGAAIGGALLFATLAPALLPMAAIF